METGAGRSNSNLIATINDLTPAAFYSNGSELFLLVNHWKLLDWKEAKRAKVCNVKLPVGFAYVSNPIKNLNEIVWQKIYG